jgi:hypothetical protein
MHSDPSKNSGEDEEVKEVRPMYPLSASPSVCASTTLLFLNASSFNLLRFLQPIHSKSTQTNNATGPPRLLVIIFVNFVRIEEDDGGGDLENG